MRSWLVLLGTLISIVGLVEESKTQPKYAQWNSKEYKQIVSHWKYSPQEAQSLAIAWCKQEGRSFYSTHKIIVDDCYLFSSTNRKTGDSINLHGFYVNGRTGVVEIRKGGVLDEDDQKKLWGAVCRKRHPMKSETYNPPADDSAKSRPEK